MGEAPSAHATATREVSSDRSSPPSPQRAGEDADLRQSLTNLSELVAGHGPRWFEDMLTHVAGFAVQAIPGADGSGITLLDRTNLTTVVASAPFVRLVDSAQYRLGEGPSIVAAAQGHPVRSGSLGQDASWPAFGAVAVELDVHSVLALPLRSDSDEVLGSINVYAHKMHAFDDRAAELGELFARPAAISVHAGRALSDARTLADRLRAALIARAVIDQSLGILMSRSGCSSTQAFDKLRVRSQAQNKKVSVVAQSIVDEAVSRARARNVQA